MGGGLGRVGLVAAAAVGMQGARATSLSASVQHALQSDGDGAEQLATGGSGGQTAASEIEGLGAKMVQQLGGQ